MIFLQVGQNFEDSVLFALKICDEVGGEEALALRGYCLLSPEMEGVFRCSKTKRPTLNRILCGNILSLKDNSFFYL